MQLRGVTEADLTTPYVLALRHAQTGKIAYLHVEPWLSVTSIRSKFRKKFGGRPGEMFDWVGVKQGDRVVFRGKRQEDGSWEWEEVDVRRTNGDSA